MPITYAGIPLTPPSNSDELVFRYWHNNQINEFEYQGYLGLGTAHLPTPFFPKRQPPRVGVLSWPTSADRFAVCHLIATDAELTQIRAVIGTTPAAQPLVITDGDGGSITTDMYLIPRPIVVDKTENSELYLLTLVDERYFWYASGDSGVTTTTSWALLLAGLFSQVGVSATIDAIPAAYLTPNPYRWVTDAPEPVPILIEAACKQNSLQVVRQLDGTVAVQTYATAAAADAARWATISDLVYTGGQITGADVGRFLPGQVDVTFFDGTSSGVTLASLGLSAYSGVVGLTTRAARYQADPHQPTAAQKTAYAIQAATDYYNWALSPTDCTLRGIVNVTLNGLDGWVEWVHTPQGIVTRILRPEWSDRNVYGEGWSFSVIPPGWVPGGDGTGSGAGSCDDAIEPVTFSCALGTRSAVVKNLSIGIVDNQLVITECSSSTTDLGPCSPVNPEGTTVPVVTKVCPSYASDAIGDVVIKPTSSYAPYFLPADGSTVSRTTYSELYAVYGTTFGVGDGSTTFELPTLADPVTGLSYYVRALSAAPFVSRRLITVPVADEEDYCEQFDEEDCCSGSGGGSGLSGSGCNDLCEECLAGMSNTWTLYTDAYETTTLVHVDNPDDGNYCRWVSPSGTWELYYDSGELAWVLVNYDTLAVWALGQGDWACEDENVLVNGEDLSLAVVVPSELCYSYNCEGSGSGMQCVQVVGSGGTYATLAECEAACVATMYDCVDGACVEGTTYSSLAECEAACGIQTDCCPGPIPLVLTVNVSAETGTCTDLPASFTLTYTATTVSGGPGWQSDPILGKEFVLKCGAVTPGVWDFAWDASDVLVLDTVGCGTLNIVYDGISLNTCSGTAIFSITE